MGSIPLKAHLLHSAKSNLSYTDNMSLVVRSRGKVGKGELGPVCMGQPMTEHQEAVVAKALKDYKRFSKSTLQAVS